MSEKNLGLDPGPGARRRRTSICSCRCLCWTICIPLLGLAACAVIYYGASVVQQARFPHKSLYHTGPSYNPEDVICPLISDEQRFDIAVSVWVRAPEDEEAEFKRLKPQSPIQEEAPTSTQIDMGERLGKVWMAVSLDEGNKMLSDEDILEKPLFSDVVFRGLRLSDKHASAKVDFRLPTARFRAANLTESDLRATFLLIPSSPSLIDHVKNFSSWMPDSVFSKRRPTRPWPFPFGSDERGEKTMADLALESFSISVPLIELHDATSQCTDGSVDVSVEIGEDEGPVVEGHPYVVTRTQLRIVRETNLFDAEAYNAVRNQIKFHSCGQGIPGIKPNLRMCRRTYLSNGNFETLLELAVPTESGVETQWAYAPYLDTKAHAAGPLDIIPVPVNRENCSSTPGEDYMDVTWRIAYAGRTPVKQTLADNIVSPQLVDHRASDLMKASQQDSAELWNGALGHRFHDDAHPRRRISLDIISGICQVLGTLLLIHYWWTRVSTVGISVSSVAFLAAGNALGPIANAMQEDDSFLPVFIPVLLIQPYWMCKVITRAEFGWKKWHPVVTIASANHRERASQRIDSRTSWGVKLGVFLGFLAVYQLVNPDGISLLATTVPAPRPGEYGTKSKFLEFLETVGTSLGAAGIFSQVLLNHRSSAYGGSYRAEVVIFCLGSVIPLFYFIPAVVGRMDMRMGLTLKPLIDLVVQLPLVWQAITLPPAQLGDDEED